MTRQNVFKSEEGKMKIRTYYKNVLNLLPLKQNNIGTSYGNTFILEAGNENNPPIILVHGSCSNSLAWLGDIGKLSEKYHVLAVDIPGEPGNSEAYRLDIASDEYALWLKEVIECLKVGKVVLVGNSMGGWLTLQFAAKFPDLLEALVLMAPSGIVHPKEQFANKIKQIEDDDTATEGVSEEVLGNVDLPEEVMEFMMLVMENFNPITTQLPVLTDEQMQQLSMPVLYIAGTNDVTMDTIKASERLSNLLPRVTLKIDERTHVITTVSDFLIPFIERISFRGE